MDFDFRILLLYINNNCQRKTVGQKKKKQIRNERT